MRHASVFSGIGAFEIAAEWMGWANIFHCEINPFARKVLNYYWPQSISYGDIKETDFTSQRGKIDILTGGFPCQPFSSAGKQRGAQDNRYLWPEMLRTVREIQPNWVVCENVAELTRMALEPRVVAVESEKLTEGKNIYRTMEGGAIIERICQDLEKENYQVQTFLIPACSINAPHRRDRVFIIAALTNTHGQRSRSRECDREKRPVCEKQQGQLSEDQSKGDKERDKFGENGHTGAYTYTTGQRFSRRQETGGTPEINPKQWQKPSRLLRPTWENFPIESPLYGGNDGVSSKLSGITFPKFRQEAIQAYGNAVVPGLAYEIFQSIQKAENEYSNKII